MILNLSNFIHSLLLENETVIIPGFGAFISTYKPAEIKGNEIKPPSKEISFTQQIKNNDGLLVEIIARKAKISQRNAMKRVDKARENMLYELDNGETVILENIGSLQYNKNNEIVFTPFQEDNLLLDSFGLESISTKDAELKISEEPIIENKVKKDHEQLADALIINSSENIKVNQAGPDSDIEEEFIAETEKIVTVSEPEPKKFIYPEFKQAEKHEEKEERKKIGWYWYLLILIPFLIGGYFIMTNYYKTDKTEFVMEHKAENETLENQIQTIPARDSVQMDTTVATLAESPVKTVDEQAVKNETSKYYLIGGGFKEQENVEEFILKLKEKGIESFVAGKKGSLILVGIGKFDTEAEAIKSLNEHFKTNPEWRVWIFKNE
jgi:nucleoid DNA-binding protein